MAKLIQIKPRENYKIHLRYSDHSEGVIDLSDMVKRGVFKKLKDKNLFDSAYISEHNTLAWNEDLELCADALYLRITGKKVEEVMPATKVLSADA